MHSPTVLIVEDEVLVALMVEEALAEAGFRPIGLCRSGVAALEQVKREPPDVLLLDLVLQGDLSGLDVAHAVREFWAGPIVFYTSASNADARERLSAVANAKVLFKPASRAELVRAVRTILTS